MNGVARRHGGTRGRRRDVEVPGGGTLLRLGWFSSGRDEAARNLLRYVHGQVATGAIDAELVFVFCDRDRGEAPGTRLGRERGRFFDLVDSLGIPAVTFSHRKFMPELRKRALAETTDRSLPSPSLLHWRDAYGERVMEAVEAGGLRADLSVLAGYMLVWSQAECEAFNGIDLHPALPWGPTGTWQEVIWRLIDDRASEQGAMMHLVSPELDRGSPVAYCRFPIRGGTWDGLWETVGDRPSGQVRAAEGAANPLFKAVRAEGERRELPLIAMTIKEFADGRLSIRHGAPYRGDTRVERGADLTEPIGRALAGGGGA